jgi:hypothetical protein
MVAVAVRAVTAWVILVVMAPSVGTVGGGVAAHGLLLRGQWRR